MQHRMARWGFDPEAGDESHHPPHPPGFGHGHPWRAAPFGPGGRGGPFDGGPGGPFGPGGFGPGGPGGPGGPFGVRRPLRFLGHRLGLDEAQMSEVVRIMEDLKTERAQAEVDRRRTQAAIAEAFGKEGFDAVRADEAQRLQVETATKQGQATRAALTKLHALLRPEQRQALADLLRSGALSL